MNCKPFASVALSLILAFSGSECVLVRAQSGNPAAQGLTGATPSILNNLKIMALEGQGGYNVIATRSATLVVVEVRDENDQILEGVDVTFRVPATGPSGMFAGSSLTTKAITTIQGQVGAFGFVPNSTPGTFQMHVTASAGSRIGSAVITQHNVQRAGQVGQFKKKSKRLWIYALLAGGAVAGIVIATQSGSSNNGGVTVSPGSPNVGGPR